MKTKSRLRLEIKEVTAEGTFEGLLSTYGNVDAGGDVVEPGAYTKTLKEGGATRPLLWQHKTSDPIGLLTLEDRPEGLWCKGRLLLDDAVPEARKAYALAKSGIVKGLSIGFESIKDSIESGVRHLKEIKLYEGSIVTFPMNDMALIVRVKALAHKNGESKGDFNEELAQIQTLNAFYDTQSALNEALCSLIWSEMTRDEKIAAAETILAQFTEAFLAFWPDYLDTLQANYGPMETWSRDQFELKAGATISAANKTKIQSVRDHIKSADEILAALVPDEAGNATSEEKAAANKSEPDDHSAAQALLSKTIEEIKAFASVPA